jgi:hypothetical protein
MLLTELYLYIKYKKDIKRNPFKKSKPKKLEFEHLNELIFPDNKFTHINPSICSQENQLIGAVRITNGLHSGKSTWNGKAIFLNSEGETLNGIAVFTVPDGLKVDNYKLIFDVASVPNYEDPRIIIHNGKSLILLTRLLANYKTNMCLYDLNSMQTIDFVNPFSKGIEKNWVPILSENQNLQVCYGVDPFTILDYNANGELISKNFVNVGNLELQGLHNRTALVKVTGRKYAYLGIHSKKFAFNKLGYLPLHFFCFYDKDFNLLTRSEPFSFSRLQLEICNGLALLGEKIFLSWTESEKNNFIGYFHINKLDKYILNS